MHSYIHLLALAASVTLCNADTSANTNPYGNSAYVLQDDYSPDKFFDMFDFFTYEDPTHGFVKYVDEHTAATSNLINTTASSIFMGVDTENITPGGRPSVRITSKASYTRGLIILDLTHMPGGQCGTWPAFWTVGPSWPESGEIDIIEGVNSQTANSMALHTTSGCSIGSGGAHTGWPSTYPPSEVEGSTEASYPGGNTGYPSGGQTQLAFTGEVSTTNCDVAAEGQPTNAGCGIKSTSSQTYGAGFNAGGGGVYATEWTSEYIAIWFFPRGAIPSDITHGNPNPSSWGAPQGAFSGGCEIDNFFKNNQIVFDTTFCGDWAGSVWGTDPVCSARAAGATCNDFVRDNPHEFQDAYWEVNSLKVYQRAGGSSGSPHPPTQPSHSAWPSYETQPVPGPTAPVPTTVDHPTYTAPTTLETKPTPYTEYSEDSYTHDEPWRTRNWGTGKVVARALPTPELTPEDQEREFLELTYHRQHRGNAHRYAPKPKPTPQVMWPW